MYKIYVIILYYSVYDSRKVEGDSRKMDDGDGRKADDGDGRNMYDRDDRKVEDGASRKVDRDGREVDGRCHKEDGNFF